MSAGSTPISSGTPTASLPGDSFTGACFTPEERRALRFAPLPSSRVSAVQCTTVTPARARRVRELRAVRDEIDRGRGLGERGQHRRRTDHAVLHFLQHERGVRGREQRGEIERHRGRGLRSAG